MCSGHLPPVADISTWPSDTHLDAIYGIRNLTIIIKIYPLAISDFNNV